MSIVDGVQKIANAARLQGRLDSCVKLGRLSATSLLERLGILIARSLDPLTGELV